MQCLLRPCPCVCVHQAAKSYVRQLRCCDELHNIDAVRFPRRKRPSAAATWKLLTAWAADVTQSGEPFPLLLRNHMWGAQTTNVICRGVCKRGCACHKKKCNFSVLAVYSAREHVLVLKKRNPHEKKDFAATEWGRHGFKIASTPESFDVQPSTEEIQQRLDTWCANTDLSKEPFPLKLNHRYTSSSATLCRGTCASSSPCKGAPHCKFVVQAVYLQHSHTFFIAVKNRHSSDAVAACVSSSKARHHVLC